MDSHLILAVSEGLPTEFLVSGLAGSDSTFELTSLAGESGLDAVRDGRVDIALVFPLAVIMDPEEIEVVPAVALSSWRYPFGQLFLPGGLESPPPVISYEPHLEQEAQLARIVLKEHYGIEPRFRPQKSASPNEGNRLHVGNGVPLMAFDGLRLDLGQEWFELANYPMVWGVFVMKKGTVTPAVVNGLREMAERTEVLRDSWAGATNGSESIRRFFQDDVRVRYDDLAVASITQLMDYAFYYDLTDEVVSFPVAAVEIDETNRGRAPLL